MPLIYVCHAGCRVDEEFQEFLEAFGDAIVDSTSREVDRLEVGIKSILPDARTVDFETH
jgi:hypothetical protein